MTIVLSNTEKEFLTIIKSTEEHVFLTIGEGETLQPYRIDLPSFEKIRGALTDANVMVILSTLASANAKTAKPYDPEKAKREAAAAALVEKINLFNQALKTTTWSMTVQERAMAVVDAREAVEEAKSQDMPILDLNVLRRLGGKLAESDTLVWSYREISRGGSKFFVYEVKADSPPDHFASEELREAMAAFQIMAHEEVLSLPEALALGEELKVTSFDVAEEGEIAYSAEVKTPRSSGNGTRTRGPWRYTGSVYPGAKDKVFNTVSDFAIFVGLSNEGDKYPHAPAKKYRENNTLVKVIPSD